MANESSGKKALKAGLGYTVGNMLVKGLSFLAIPLFARLMTVEDFGIYSTFSSYVMIMTVLAGFTLHTSVRNAKLDYAERTGSYCSSVTLLVIGNSLLLQMCIRDRFENERLDHLLSKESSRNETLSCKFLRSGCGSVCENRRTRRENAASCSLFNLEGTRDEDAVWP